VRAAGRAAFSAIVVSPVVRIVLIEDNDDLGTMLRATLVPATTP
jgi:hypothetical protein